MLNCRMLKNEEEYAKLLAFLLLFPICMAEIIENWQFSNFQMNFKKMENNLEEFLRPWLSEIDGN